MKKVEAIRARLEAFYREPYSNTEAHQGFQSRAPTDLAHLLAVADAARAFLIRWEEVLPEIKAAGFIAWNHGHRYEGPTTEAPINELRTLLDKEEE